MDREHIKGAADKVKGAVKDTAGKVTGDKKMQAEGKMDKAKGAAHNAVGDAKDTARDATLVIASIETRRPAPIWAAFLLAISCAASGRGGSRSGLPPPISRDPLFSPGLRGGPSSRAGCRHSARQRPKPCFLPALQIA